MHGGPTIQEKTSRKLCSPLFWRVGRCHLRAETAPSFLVKLLFVPPNSALLLHARPDLLFTLPHIQIGGLCSTTSVGMSLATIRRWWAALNYEPFQISRTIRWDVDQFEVWIAGLHTAKSLSSEERWTSHAEARCE